MFHVPDERFRVVWGEMASDRGINAGAFVVDSVEPGWRLFLICDDGRCPGCATGWEHVSVRAARKSSSRVPTWREMAHIKSLCWDAEDVVVEFHPARSSYVNRHPHVLHLWRPIYERIPVPPIGLV